MALSASPNLKFTTLAISFFYYKYVLWLIHNSACEVDFPSCNYNIGKFLCGVFDIHNAQDSLDNLIGQNVITWGVY